MTTNGLPDFSRRLNALFDESRDPSTHKPYTNVTVAGAVTDGGVSVTHSYIGQLRNGSRQEPSASLVGALAQFFDIPVDYFFGVTIAFEPGELSRRLRLVSQLRGDTFSSADLVRAVEASGEPFNADDWTHLLEPTGPVRARKAVLEAIAGFFDIRSDYLTTRDLDAELERYEADLDLAAAAEELGITGVATRALGAPTPRAIRAIAAALRKNHAAASS